MQMSKVSVFIMPVARPPAVASRGVSNAPTAYSLESA